MLLLRLRSGCWLLFAFLHAGLVDRLGCRDRRSDEYAAEDTQWNHDEACNAHGPREADAIMVEHLIERNRPEHTSER